MRRSLDWGAMAACLFLVIITIAISIGTWNMMRTPLEPRAIALGLICSGGMCFVAVYYILNTWNQFKNKERTRKIRKIVNEFKEME